MTRFTPFSTGFSLFALSKNAQAFRAAPDLVLDEPNGTPPLWRRPQPAPHTLEEHAINLVTSGDCRYVYRQGGQTHRVTVGAGAMFLVPGGIYHTMEVDDFATVRGFCIHPRIVAALGQPPAPLCDFREPLAPLRVVSAGQNSVLQELWEQVQLEYARPCDRFQTEAIRAIGRLAAIAFVRMMTDDPEQAGAESAAQTRVAAVRAYMDRNYAERLTLTDLSQRAVLSVSQFSFVFRVLFGVSPKAYLIQCRLNQAATRLAQTDLPVQRIARDAGFGDVSGFNALFKTHFGTSPGNYRKNRLENRRFPADTPGSTPL